MLLRSSVALLILLVPASAFAQSLEEKRKRKLAEPFSQKAAWVTNYRQAMAESRKTGKAIFAYFTPSYEV